MLEKAEFNTKVKAATLKCKKSCVLQLECWKYLTQKLNNTWQLTWAIITIKLWHFYIPRIDNAKRYHLKIYLFLRLILGLWEHR